MPDLLLVPTRVEADFVRESLSLDSGRWALQLCGFGPIAAAARTGTLIARHNPERVILLGIAGTFDSVCFPIGTAHVFDQVVCFGVGIGTGQSYTSASDLGWMQFDGDAVDKKVSDRIRIGCGYPGNDESSGVLLTAPTASADSDDADRRQLAFPDARAEDMEGFAVAAACQTASIPLCIVRGISNRVGVRDKEQWSVAQAMRAACDVARRMIEDEQT